MGSSQDDTTRRRARSSVAGAVMLVGLLGALSASAQERSSPLMLEDRTRVTRALLLEAFEDHGFEFGAPSTIIATGVPQQIGQKDTTLVTLVGIPAALAEVAVIGISTSDNQGFNATIMLGMAVALQQLAPWAADWWAETGPELAKQATARDDQTATAETDNGVTRVEFTINATLAMWMLSFQRVPR